MDNRLLPVGLVFVLVFALIPSITFAVAPALPLSASPNPFTLSNTVINVGQYSTANTLVSGGSGGPYSAQWTWVNSNEVNNQVINTITVGTNSHSVSFNPSGTLAYVVNGGSLVGIGTVNVIQVSSNSVINTITVGSDPDSVSFNPSGTLAYVVNYNSGTVNVIQVSSNSVINTITVGSAPASLSFNPSGTLAYVANAGSDTVNVIQVSSNSVINTITVGTNPYSVAFNPSGTLAYVVNYNSGTVNVIQVSSNSVISTITVGTNPQSVAFNPSGTLAYVANEGSNTVNVIQVSSNSVINTITVGTNPASLSFNPSGTLAYVANAGSDTVSVIGNLPETSLQEVQSSGLVQLTVHAVNSNTIAFTFNGVTYTESTGQNTIYGAWTLYGFVQDNGTDIYYYGSNTLLLSNTLTINPALSTPTITPSNPTIDNGQSVTFSSTWSGGTTDYTTKLYSSSTSTCNTGSTLVQTLSSLTSGSASFTSVSPTSTTYYCIFVTDGASTPATVNSVNSEVTVNPALSTPTISPSNPTIDSGQSVTFSSTWTGGTPDYTAKLYSSSTSTCNTGGTLAQTISSLTSGSTPFNPVTPTSTTYYCIFITDSASTPVTANSINSEVMVNTGPQISNPYSGGATGYFGPNSTLSSSTTSTTTISSSTTILPVTTIAPITASPGTMQVCNDSSGYTINYPSLNATIKIAPESGCFGVNVVNSTLQSKTLNRSVITALNYSVNNTNVSAEAVLHYSCSIPNSDVAPFILRNSTWQEITPFTLNATACTVEFAVPADPVIALLNTNVTSTINTTAATTTAQTSVTTVPAPQQNNSLVLILILVILVIIVIAVLFIYLRNRR